MRKTWFFACWGTALLSFALGYGLGGLWPWEACVAICAAAWLLAWKSRADICLALSALVAAVGLALSAPALPMIAGAAASLLLWDLAEAGLPVPSRVARRDPASEKAAKDYLGHRLPLALLALGIGTLVAAIGSGVSIAIPFYAITAFVVVAALCFYRALR
jgi:hypothetical protein